MVMVARQPTENLSELPREALIREPDVLRIIPVSRSTWLNGCKSGRYPKPIRISERGNAWQYGAILDLAEKLGERA